MTRWKSLARFRLRFLLLLVTIVAVISNTLRPTPPPPDHWVIDVEGKAISGAKLWFFQIDLEKDRDSLPDKAYAYVTADEGGGYAFPYPEQPSDVAITVLSKGYGKALARFSEHDLEPDSHHLRFLLLPLTESDSDYTPRAVRGRVVDNTGGPIANAEIRCDLVEKPGGGYVQPVGIERHSVVTGEDGSFRFYLPASRAGRGFKGVATHEHLQASSTDRLIPLNSDYEIRVLPPLGSKYFPTTQLVNNVNDATVRLSDATKEHRFLFENLEGGLLADPGARRWITVSHLSASSDRRRNRQVRLPDLVVREGGYLQPGEYAASYRDRLGRTIYWDNLTVTPNSPKKLRFRIPESLVFCGRVIDGQTGNPIAGAFVGGGNGGGHQDLTQVTADDWETLNLLPRSPELDSPGVAPLLKWYNLDAIVRTDDVGRFKLTQPPGVQFHSLYLCQQGRLPSQLTVHGLREGQEKETLQFDAGDVPLFPAARLVVHPVFDATLSRRSVSLSPHWHVNNEDLPEWHAKLPSMPNQNGKRAIDTVHWMDLNEKQVILVPAGVKFWMEFRTPYDDEWEVNNRDEIFQIAEGEEADFGELTFVPAIEVRIRVVGPDGQTPVEGAPVRRLVESRVERVWSVSHSTNAQGYTRFHTPPHSVGEFAVMLLPQEGERIHVPVRYDASKFQPHQVLQIELTGKQVQTIMGGKANVPRR